MNKHDQALTTLQADTLSLRLHLWPLFLVLLLLLLQLLVGLPLFAITATTFRQAAAAYNAVCTCT